MALNMNLSIAPLVALLAGILILVMPRLLNYIVALYLIIIGCLGLFGRRRSPALRHSEMRGYARRPAPTPIR